MNLLADGLIKFYTPDLTYLKQQLKELTEKQNLLIEQLHDENLKVCWAQNWDDLHNTFNLIKIYQCKLVNIKKDMRNLHDKSAKLKKRALRLQQYKEREIYIKTCQVQQEQDLIGKKEK
ncbi:hypothetical protein FQA39_LY18132 [Lamprigera yunnana]|nr:hypothetical protein FQA39_LY18132 [Lamprigera yunnana]